MNLRNKYVEEESSWSICRYQDQHSSSHNYSYQDQFLAHQLNIQYVYLLNLSHCDWVKAMSWFGWWEAKIKTTTILRKELLKIILFHFVLISNTAISGRRKLLRPKSPDELLFLSSLLLRPTQLHLQGGAKNEGLLFQSTILTYTSF